MMKTALVMVRVDDSRAGQGIGGLGSDKFRFCCWLAKLKWLWPRIRKY